MGGKGGGEERIRSGTRLDKNEDVCLIWAFTCAPVRGHDVGDILFRELLEGGGFVTVCAWYMVPGHPRMLFSHIKSHNKVRGHRTDSGVEEYPTEKKHKQNQKWYTYKL